MSSSASFMSGENVVTSNRIIYTPTAFARTNLIYLQEVGTLSALRVHESRRHQLSSYLFFIVLKGSGTLTVDDISYPMKPGDCAFVDCMRKYSHKSSEDLWHLTWVHFNGSNMPGIYEKYRDRGGQYCFRPADGFETFSNIISDIYHTASSQSYIRDMEINEKLAQLLTELMRNSWHPEHSKSVSIKRKDLRNVRDYLDTHYAENIKLDDLAKMFYINKFYLTHIFKEQYGTTVNNYLTQVRITNAKKHLRFTDWGLERIGAECGYKDANYFIRMFKKAEGMTPGEFRNKWMNQ